VPYQVTFALPTRHPGAGGPSQIPESGSQSRTVMPASYPYAYPREPSLGASPEMNAEFPPIGGRKLGINKIHNWR
jgi:hypothetical protein